MRPRRQISLMKWLRMKFALVRKQNRQMWYTQTRTLISIETVEPPRSGRARSGRAPGARHVSVQGDLGRVWRGVSGAFGSVLRSFGPRFPNRSVSCVLASVSRSVPIREDGSREGVRASAPAQQIAPCPPLAGMAHGDLPPALGARGARAHRGRRRRRAPEPLGHARGQESALAERGGQGVCALL